MRHHYTAVVVFFTSIDASRSEPILVSGSGVICARSELARLPTVRRNSRGVRKSPLARRHLRRFGQNFGRPSGTASALGRVKSSPCL
jgi:hypothetical protein